MPLESFQSNGLSIRDLTLEKPQKASRTLFNPHADLLPEDREHVQQELAPWIDGRKRTSVVDFAYLLADVVTLGLKPQLTPELQAWIREEHQKMDREATDEVGNFYDVAYLLALAGERPFLQATEQQELRKLLKSVSNPRRHMLDHLAECASRVLLLVGEQPVLTAEDWDNMVHELEEERERKGHLVPEMVLQMRILGWKPKWTEKDRQELLESLKEPLRNDEGRINISAAARRSILSVSEISCVPEGLQLTWDEGFQKEEITPIPDIRRFYSSVIDHAS